MSNSKQKYQDHSESVLSSRNSLNSLKLMILLILISIIPRIISIIILSNSNSMSILSSIKLGYLLPDHLGS